MRGERVGERDVLRTAKDVSFAARETSRNWAEQTAALGSPVQGRRPRKDLVSVPRLRGAVGIALPC